VSTRRAHDYNADHVALSTSLPLRATAIAIADGHGDDAIAVICAEIAAETAAPAAAHTAMAAAGINAAREAVYHFFAADPEDQIATAAIVTAVITDRGIDLAWAGDSLVLALDTRNALHLLTDPQHPLDPALFNVSDGTIRERFVWTVDSPRMQRQDDLRLDVRRLVVCSNGLTHHLTPEEITQVLIRATTPQEACYMLAAAAVSADTNDNITIAVADLPVTQGDVAPW
jgi:protein phosphatase